MQSFSSSISIQHLSLNQQKVFFVRNDRLRYLQSVVLMLRCFVLICRSLKMVETVDIPAKREVS